MLTFNNFYTFICCPIGDFEKVIAGSVELYNEICLSQGIRHLSLTGKFELK